MLAAGRGRGREVARDWANECATYWRLVGGGRGARGGENPCEIPPRSKVRGGRRCVAVTSDSRASCRRRLTDGVFYDRVAAALQGLGGRTLETPRSFLAVDFEPIAL